jgi:hypothetical protein
VAGRPEAQNCGNQRQGAPTLQMTVIPGVKKRRDMRSNFASDSKDCLRRLGDALPRIRKRAGNDYSQDPPDRSNWSIIIGDGRLTIDLIVFEEWWAV